jgi:hypothetical protein
MRTTSTALGGGTVAASVRRDRISVEDNPRTRRFGVNPGVPVLEVHPRHSGRQQANIPYGVPVRFDTFPDMSTPTWSVDPEDRSSPVAPADLTAREAVENVKRAAWQSSADMGFRELRALTPVGDDEAERLLALVFPDLDPDACRYPAENTTRLDADTEVFRCLSCTLAWLESDVCKAAAAGDAVASALRTQFLDAYRTNEAFFTAKWQEWLAEMELRKSGKEGLARLGEGHLHVMYQLHETSPENRAAETIRENQQAQADAMKEGLREVAQELRAGIQPQQPAVDVNEIVRQATERAKAELRAEMAAEREQQLKNGKGGK